MASNLMSSDYSANKIYKHSGFSSTITDSFSTGYAYGGGLTWDGTDLYAIETGSKCYKYSGFSSTITDSFNSGKGATAYGATIDANGNFYHSGYTDAKVWKFSGFSSSITDSFSTPSAYPSAVTWDGTDIYTADVVVNKLSEHRDNVQKVRQPDKPKTNPRKD